MEKWTNRQTVRKTDKKETKREQKFKERQFTNKSSSINKDKQLTVQKAI